MISFSLKPQPSKASGTPSFFPSPKLTPKEEEAATPKDSFLPGGVWERESKPQETETVKAPAEKDSSPSLDSLSSAQSAALAALPAAPAAALKEVWSALTGKSGLQNQFLKLLENGTLAKSDGKKTVVEGLRNLSAQDRAPGVSGTYVTEQTVAMLAEPEKNIQQGKSFTCGAAAAQYQMTSYPSLFVEAVDQLTDPEGVFNLHGATFQRVPGFQADDRSDRERVNRIIQDAFMQAAGGPARGTYDALSDTFADGSKGLKTLEIAKLAANIENAEQAVVLHDGETSKVFRELFEKLPLGRATQIGAYWNQQDHMLVYRGQENGTASLFNPQTQGVVSLPVNELLFKTQFAIFPADLVRPRAGELPDDAVYFVPPDQGQKEH